MRRWCGNFAGNPGEGGVKKTGRKRESSARSATSALTISGAGIRSTVIIWTGQRNLAGRGNLRDGRGPPLPPRPSQFAFQHTKPCCPPPSPSLQRRPHESFLLSTRAACVRVCVRKFRNGDRSLLRGARKKERKREEIKKRRGEGKREFEDSNSLLFPFNSQKFLIPFRLDDFFPLV